MRQIPLALITSLLAISGCTNPGDGDSSGVTLAQLLDTDLTNTSSARSYDYVIRLTEESVSSPPGRTDAGWKRAEVFIPHSAFGIPVPLPQSNPFFLNGDPTGEPVDHYRLNNSFYNPGTDPSEDPLDQITTTLMVYVGPIPIPESYSDYRVLLGINEMNLAGMPTLDEIRPLGNPTCDYANETVDEVDEMVYVMQRCQEEGSTCFRLSHQDPEGGPDTADYIVPALRRADLLEECLHDNETTDDDDSAK